MSTKKTVFMSCGGSYSGGMPHTLRPEDFDSWPSDQANTEVIATIAEILRHGYEGVVVESHQLTDGRVIGKFFTNSVTPEGRVVAELLALARIGDSLPTSQVIILLENAYRLNGLTLPQKYGSVN